MVTKNYSTDAPFNNKGNYYKETYVNKNMDEGNYRPQQYNKTYVTERIVEGDKFGRDPFDRQGFENSRNVKTYVSEPGWTTSTTQEEYSKETSTKTITENGKTKTITTTKIRYPDGRVLEQVKEEGDDGYGNTIVKNLENKEYRA